VGLKLDAVEVVDTLSDGFRRTLVGLKLGGDYVITSSRGVSDVPSWG